MERKDLAQQSPTEFTTRESVIRAFVARHGVDSQDGVIVVATANDPTVLDSAILRRPGRFDRVVAIPAPDLQLRLRYFRKFNPYLDEESIFRVAEDSDGFSFAQLKEVYILAGQMAFVRNTEVTGNDLLEGVRVLRGGLA